LQEIRADLCGQSHKTLGGSMKIIGRMLAAAAVCGMALAVAGCNTTKGVGQDVKAAGSGLENAAERSGAHND
jgi:predicted small secreted protein